MTTKELHTTDEVQSAIAAIEGHYRKEKDKSGQFGYISTPLYRGHADSSWSLETTLERAGEVDITLERYYRRYASPAYRYLSGFLERKLEYDEKPSLNYSDVQVKLPNYGFLAYLRHHGFPSPLLDWSSSPYIALYFAFHQQTDPTINSVALYCYEEYTGHGKAYTSSQPYISSFGPWEQTHPRHHLQQCEYTMCMVQDDKDLKLTCHEDAFSLPPDRLTDQDRLTKLIIDSSLRLEIMRWLFRMNVTPYSIFKSEDALVKGVSDRLFLDL